MTSKNRMHEYHAPRYGTYPIDRKMKKGDIVQILNTNLSGTVIQYEGQARVVKVLDEERAVVKFDADGDVCERNIDWDAQDDPAGYAAALNRRAGK